MGGCLPSLMTAQLPLTERCCRFLPFSGIWGQNSHRPLSSLLVVVAPSSDIGRGREQGCARFQQESAGNSKYPLFWSYHDLSMSQSLDSFPISQCMLSSMTSYLLLTWVMSRLVGCLSASPILRNSMTFLRLSEKMLPRPRL